MAQMLKIEGEKQANPKWFIFFVISYCKFVVWVFLSFSNRTRILKALDFIHPVETEKREKNYGITERIGLEVTSKIMQFQAPNAQWKSNAVLGIPKCCLGIALNSNIEESLWRNMGSLFSSGLECVPILKITIKCPHNAHPP